jgi:hypothetical protein
VAPLGTRSAEAREGDQLKGRGRGDGLHQQHPGQREQLDGGRLDLGYAAEKHPDEGAGRATKPTLGVWSGVAIKGRETNGNVSVRRMECSCCP